MGQHKLKLDDLEVESFHVLPAPPDGRGTVRAQSEDGADSRFVLLCKPSFTCFASCGAMDCSFDGNFTCTCDASCGGSCDASCGGSCGNSCQETCGCSLQLGICEVG